MFLNREFSPMPDALKTADVKWFTPGGAATTTWQVWSKPRGVQMVMILAVGAGGGGGNGFSAAAGSARGGGGGGGSGAISRVIIPAILLPDVLYVSPGVGGAATAAGS